MAYENHLLTVGHMKTIYDNIKEDQSDLKSAISENMSDIKTVERAKYGNLFDWVGGGCTRGQYRNASGELNTSASTSYATSNLIFVKKGVEYKFRTNAGEFGSAGARTVGIYGLDRKYLKYITATDAGSNTATFTPTEDCFAQFNVYWSNRNYLKFAESALYADTDNLPRQGISADKLYVVGGIDGRDLSFANIKYTGNLFNAAGKVFTGYYFDRGAYGLVANDSCAAQFVPFVGPGTYSFLHYYGHFGTTAQTLAFGENHQFLGYFTATIDGSSGTSRAAHIVATSANLTWSGYTSTNRFSDIKYLGITCDKTLVNSIMVVHERAYPSEYVPYTFDTVLDVVDTKENAEYLTHTKSANLFNRWDNLEYCKYFNTGNSGNDLLDSQDCISQYIPFAGEGTYWMMFYFTHYGSGSKVVLFDKNKQKLRSLDVTKQDSESSSSQPGYVSITGNNAADVAYIGYTIFRGWIGSAMFVKADSYPESYVEYQDTWDLDGVNSLTSMPNQLYRKKVLYDGDSICDYRTDVSNKGGYPGRIASANHMRSINYGVGGGTITAGLYSGEDPRHWVSANVDTMYAAHPDADYVIFEGGTNDADLIGRIVDANNDPITPPEAFGSFSSTDFSGEYDDETFCGAVETMLYKALANWPHAKIGYIAGPKMGGEGTSIAFFNRIAYWKKAEEICAKWGVPCLNLCEKCHANPRMTEYWDPDMTTAENREAGHFYGDGQHPTPTGYDDMSTIINEWMRTL